MIFHELFYLRNYYPSQWYLLQRICLPQSRDDTKKKLKVITLRRSFFRGNPFKKSFSRQCDFTNQFFYSRDFLWDGLNPKAGSDDSDECQTPSEMPIAHVGMRRNRSQIVIHKHGT